jgi:hypothetical protein
VKAWDTVTIDPGHGIEAVDTPAAGHLKRPSRANTKLKTRPVTNKPAVAQTVRQTQDGATAHTIVNATEQRQSVNINQPVSSPLSGREKKH